MRRALSKNFEKYIEVRTSQLEEDMNKAHDEHDKMWYKRLIQELKWVSSPHHNCYMEEENGLSL